MSIRRRLVLSNLMVAALVAATGYVSWRVDLDSARHAAVAEAVHVAMNIGQDITYGNTDGGQLPIYDQPERLASYIQRVHDLHGRDIVVVDLNQRILGDAVPANIGTIFNHDTGDEVDRTIGDGTARTFMERSVDYPAGIRQVVVAMRSTDAAILGAVILEYTPLYNEVMARTRSAQTTIVVTSAACILIALLLGLFLAEQIVRRLQLLTEAVGGIRNGEYWRRISDRGRDELTVLGQAFNVMAAELEQSAKEILAKEYTDGILASADEGICGVDATDRIMFANAAAGRIIGLDAADLLGRCATDLLPEASMSLLGASVRVDEAHRREGDLVRPDGTVVRISCTMSPILKNDQQTGAVLVVRDVSHQHALEYDLRHQALHDALTGLPNRVHFHNRLRESLANARSSACGPVVLFIDLDGFKEVNDSLGHDAGDLLLQRTAHRLRAAIVGTDVAARFGGDEFAVLLDGSDESTALELTRRLLLSLSEPVTLDGRQVIVSASVGLVVNAGQYANAKDVMRDADLAMYQAKSHGKACFEVFMPQMREQAVW